MQFIKLLKYKILVKKKHNYNNSWNLKEEKVNTHNSQNFNELHKRSMGANGSFIVRNRGLKNHDFNRDDGAEHFLQKKKHI